MMIYPGRKKDESRYPRYNPYMMQGPLIILRMKDEMKNEKSDTNLGYHILSIVENARDVMTSGYGECYRSLPSIKCIPNSIGDILETPLNSNMFTINIPSGICDLRYMFFTIIYSGNLFSGGWDKLDMGWEGYRTSLEMSANYVGETLNHYEKDTLNEEAYKTKYGEPFTEFTERDAAYAVQYIDGGGCCSQIFIITDRSPGHAAACNLRD